VLFDQQIKFMIIILLLQKRFDNRESRTDDVASIMDLKRSIALKDIKVKKLLGDFLIMEIKNICKFE
jgi:hypothetical protein